MTTTSPVPSADPSDLLFNAQCIDRFVNSTETTFVDRLGHVHPTLAGLGDQTGFFSGALTVDVDNNVGAVKKMTAPRFVATHTDDTGTPDASFRSTGTLTALTINGGHAFRDETTISGGVAGSGYAAFDAQPTLSATGFDHVVSFQSRPIISGNPTHVYGLTHAPVFASGANAVNSYAVFAANATGAGTVQNVFGVYIPIQSKGSVSNHALYIAQQGAPSFVGSPLQINNVLTVNPGSPFVVGGSTTLGYPFYGYNYDPSTDDKRVSDVAVTTKLDTGGLHVYVKSAGAPLGGSGMLASMTEGLRVDTTGAVFLPAVGTTASAANAYINNGASNQVLRSTSSIRYKTDVIDVPADAVDRLMTLRPVRYRSLAPADNGAWSYYGLIAEEVAQVDPRLVHWSYQDSDYERVEQRTETPILVDTGIVDEHGKSIIRSDVEVRTEMVTRLKAGAQLVPDGVQYERLAVLLLAEVKALRAQLAAHLSGGA